MKKYSKPKIVKFNMKQTKEEFIKSLKKPRRKIQETKEEYKKRIKKKRFFFDRTKITDAEFRDLVDLI